MWTFFVDIGTLSLLTKFLHRTVMFYDTVAHFSRGVMASSSGLCSIIVVGFGPALIRLEYRMRKVS